MHRTDSCFLPNEQILIESQPLANAVTSLSTLRRNKPSLFESKQNLQLTACRCSQRKVNRVE